MVMYACVFVILSSAKRRIQNWRSRVLMLATPWHVAIWAEYERGREHTVMCHLFVVQTTLESPK